MTSFRVGLARARNGEEVPNRREDDVRLGGESVDEVGVIEPVLKEWRQALLCVLRSYAFEQPLPRGDVAGRRGDTDPPRQRPPALPASHTRLVMQIGGGYPPPSGTGEKGAGGQRGGACLGKIASTLNKPREAPANAVLPHRAAAGVEPPRHSRVER